MSGSFPEGFRYLPEYFSRAQQQILIEHVSIAAKAAPFFRGKMPRTGTPLSTLGSNFGPLGWVAAQSGYRYCKTHPKTGKSWPNMPEELLNLWQEVSDWLDPPQACLINWYREGAKLGLHVDADEEAADAPVVSVSLGDQALYRLGGPARKDPTRSFKLSSGDVCILGGASRRCFHGIDRIYPGTSTLVPKGGRINLTLRVVRGVL
ncbi:MAG: alpha-ketoglutarate-dependent dioxygenase AlkB [Robiginitomaculum sp.]|nr:alpha-ketoglutarate-dependent dioxygenase AlkB [Robiginitomaculum sp.]